MLAIQPGGGDGGDEELRTLGVRAGVGHAQVSLLGVLDLEVLVVELAAVDRFASDTSAVGEVASLYTRHTYSNEY